MSEPLVPLVPIEDEPADAARKKQLIMVGGIAGVAILGLGAFYLLSSGGSGDNQALPVPVHHVVTTATPSPSSNASQESVLQTYHGSVGDRDPFAIPAAVLAAQPAPAAAAAPAAAGAAATPTPAASLAPGTLTIPTTLPTGTTVTVPGSTAPTVAAPLPDQYLQLLATHHTHTGWTVDVRTASGVAKYVKAGTKNVDGTLFYFQGEDETSGTPTFVFTVGESQGGNLIPNAKESATKRMADKSTLVLHNGVVDGGIYAE